MKPITQQELTDYVEANIQIFHQRRLENLQKLKLMNVVKRKNPYLFKAKNINTASEFVKTILEAHLSSPKVWTILRIKMDKKQKSRYHFKIN